MSSIFRYRENLSWKASNETSFCESLISKIFSFDEVTNFPSEFLSRINRKSFERTILRIVEMFRLKSTLNFRLESTLGFFPTNNFSFSLARIYSIVSCHPFHGFLNGDVLRNACFYLLLPAINNSLLTGFSRRIINIYLGHSLLGHRMT